MNGNNRIKLRITNPNPSLKDWLIALLLWALILMLIIQLRQDFNGDFIKNQNTIFTIILCIIFFILYRVCHEYVHALFFKCKTGLIPIIEIPILRMDFFKGGYIAFPEIPINQKSYLIVVYSPFIVFFLLSIVMIFVGPLIFVIPFYIVFFVNLIFCWNDFQAAKEVKNYPNRMFSDDGEAPILWPL